MPVKSIITTLDAGKSIWTPDGISAPLMGVITQASVFGRFKATSITAQTAGTIIVTPPASESIVLTDLIFSAEKKNLGTDTFRFYDGTNTVDIIVGSVGDGPLNLAIGFQGHWQGWRDAYLQIVQDGADHVANVAVGYYFVRKELSHPYAKWNALRDARE